MTCKRCRKSFDEGAPRCPHCGAPNPAASGMFQTSTVLISEGGSEAVYRSVAEVPAHLRSKLEKCTNGANSATILIADRRGQREIAKAMRNLPGPAQRRLMHSLLGRAAAAPGWLTPLRKRIVLAVLMALALALISLVFVYRWQ